ncbi:beta-glucan synthesis-associated [Roridomyces roridus]|uniref:Beta-glucan synthesis-associated n=1 Tax=Roridomyces roridus TaxID=1738132 RepID=A0AAD7FRV4_9AGAR|nr:beta-glucan synthesis-associated [Roridomyces roridus]
MPNPASPQARYFPVQSPPASAGLLSSQSPTPQSGTPLPSRSPSLRASSGPPRISQAGSMFPPSRGRVNSMVPSISEKFQLAPDPTSWGPDINQPEPDDMLHDPRRDSPSHNIFTGRGFQNLGCITLLALVIVGLFIGYPVTTHFTNPVHIDILHVNATGQMPSIGNWALIDQDTPKEMYNIYGYNEPSQVYQLVFSDEFEMDGRSFYPGDDPYWEAVDLHYWQTGNLEWYDPSHVTTRDGALEFTLSEAKDPELNHNLNYTGAMISTWNKFCFTSGILLANVMLPGTNSIFGLWPAVWAMGNLGRAGYGATLDGMWPYVYDACDVGTLPNQTLADGSGPDAALTSGDPTKPYFGELSYLPGQRLSRCTCAGESHPGPIHSDGTYVGRSAPEIDVFEAQIGGPNKDTGEFFGTVSQSAQWAPFNAGYLWDNSSSNLIMPNPSTSHQNSYSGGVFQQATSVVSHTNQSCYQLLDGCYSVHGFDYSPGFDNAYITWLTNNEVTWTLNVAGVGADTQTEISGRQITGEPMYILANLGMSHAFGAVDLDHITFPAIMRIDWIRVYQQKNKINVGCDTTDYPTKAYIDTYIEAYTNPNLTTWTDDYKQPMPKNKLKDQC